MLESDLLTRLKSATAADQREVLREWFGVVRGPEPEVWEDEKYETTTREYADWVETGWLFGKRLNCGAYLDAVLGMMPEGCGWFVSTTAFMGGYARLSLPDGAMACQHAPTPALALAAALLKAKDP